MNQWRQLFLTLVLAVLPTVDLFASNFSGELDVEQFNKNGINFVIDEDRAIPIITFGISIDAGAVQDPVNKEGLTQMMMDMLMRGTKTRNRDTINEEIEFLGATLSTNAGYTTSGIEGEVISRYLDQYMTMVSDILLNPNFTEAELKQLKKETLDWMKLALDNDTHLCRKYFSRTVFGAHPYGRPVDGTQASLENITLQDIKDRYDSLVRKGLMTIYAAGDIDKETLLNITTKYFSRIPDGGIKPGKTPPVLPLQKRHLLIVDKPDRSQIQLCIGAATIPYNSPDYYPLTLANTAFGGFFNARYTDEIRVKRGWSYHASSNLSFFRDAGMFYLRTFTSMQNVGPLVKKSLEMLVELQDKGITDEELAKAKSNTINEFPFMIDTADKRVDEKLRAKSFNLPDDFLEAYQKRFAKVTGSDVRDATRRLIDANSLAIVAVCEAKRCRKELEASIDSLASVVVVPYDKI